MKEKEITKIVYETNDGKTFDTKEEAQAYEDQLNMFKAIKQFKVKGPETSHRILEYSDLPYLWYRLNNDAEAAQFSALLGRDVVPIKYPEHILIIVLKGECITYYIKFMYLSEILDQYVKHEKERKKKFMAFIDEFEFPEDERNNILQFIEQKDNR